MLGLLLLLTSISQANAKTIHLQWKEIPGASAYEISIKSEERNTNPISQKLKKPEYSGELKAGLYSYQVRAIDRLERPGKWSSTNSLVVMPEAPSFTSPKTDETATYRRFTNVHLTWKNPDGLKKVRLIVLKDGKEIENTVVSGNSFELKKATAAKYTFKIKPHVEGRGIASSNDRSWDGNSASELEYEVTQKELRAPNIAYPSGKTNPPSDGKVKIGWEPVEGAEAYRVVFSPKDDPKNQKIYTTKDSNINIDGASTKGSYKVQVRALASVDSSNNTADVQGPIATSEFEFSPYANRAGEERGYMALSLLYSSYNLSEISAAYGFNGQTSSNVLGVRISGEYFVTPDIAIGGAIQNYQYSIANLHPSETDAEIQAKYRFALSQSPNAFILYPKVGVGLRGLFMLSPQLNSNNNFTGNATSSSFSEIGPFIGLDVRKRIFERVSLGLKTSYFFPVAMLFQPATISGLDGSSSNGGNISAGLQAFYWFNDKISFGAGLFHENRSIGFHDSGPNGTSNDSVDNSATYLFASMLYRLGE